jgi:glycerol-3-phosphate dehydrogenase
MAVVLNALKKRKLAVASVAAVGSGIGYFVVSRQQRKKHVQTMLHSAEETAWSTRAENMAKFGQREFDLLVIGGGASGCGAALDAATRGLDVALIEQEDFGSGTSSRSTKLIWAGSRYLVQGLTKLFSPALFWDPMGTITEFQGTFHMVMGCHRERAFMTEMNPHLVKWLPICVPLDRWIIWPPPFGYVPAAIGPIGMFPLFFKFYDFLGGFCSPNSYIMSTSRAALEFPQLAARSQSTMKYVSVFYEGQHDDSRTNLAIAMTAAKNGAAISNYTEAVDILKDANGKAIGCKVRDVTTGKVFDIKAKNIIFCGGPFTDDLRKLNEGEDVKKCVKGATGTHIVLPGYFTPPGMGFVDMAVGDGSQGRFMFVLHWLGHTLIGTTDTTTPTPTLDQKPPEEEIQWILSEASKYISPSTGLCRDHVLSAWQGTRPLVVDPNADPNNSASASRDHTVSRHDDSGIVFLSGGKWTTYREMAEDAVDKVLEHDKAMKTKATPCKTLEVPLVGTGPVKQSPGGWHPNLSYELVKQYGMRHEVAQHLADAYGTRAHEVLEYAKGKVADSKSGLSKHYGRLYEGYPYIEPEVRYAVHKEYAVTAADIIARRTRMAYLNIKAAELITPRVCEIMGEELGWSRARVQQEIAATKKSFSKNFVGQIPEALSSPPAAVGQLNAFQDPREVVTADTDKKSGVAFG